MSARKSRRKSASSKLRIDKSQLGDYDYHFPVLLEEAVDFLVTDKQGTYIDGTLGGGGHARAIMQRFDSGGNLFAFDKDVAAILRAQTLFEEEINSLPPRLVLFNTSFSEASSICQQRGINPAGILLDLGVSSQQLDTDQRGISYRVDSPLDMRFGENGITAREILNTYSEEAISTILYTYGEEPRSRFIAKRIVEMRNIQPFNTTFDLRKIIEEITPSSQHFKTLSRVFQAIRIEVNQEIDVLTKTLNDIIGVLTTSGRIVVISYHSLEDRVVKQIFKANAPKTKINKYAEVLSNNMAKLEILTQKPIVPSKEEILRNPRARSAKMRVAEKL